MLALELDRDLRPGDPADFDRLYRMCYPRIYRTLLAALGDHAAAEDCAQDTFVRAFAAWGRWRPDAPVEAWLYTIAVRVASNWRKRERLRQVGEILRRFGRIHETSEDPEDAAVLGTVGEAVRALGVVDAAIVTLHHLHGYPTSHIALAVGMSERTVRWRLQRARERLRAALGEWELGAELLPVAAPSAVLHAD